MEDCLYYYLREQSMAEGGASGLQIAMPQLNADSLTINISSVGLRNIHMNEMMKTASIYGYASMVRLMDRNQNLIAFNLSRRDFNFSIGPLIMMRMMIMIMRIAQHAKFFVFLRIIKNCTFRILQPKNLHTSVSDSCLWSWNRFCRQQKYLVYFILFYSAWDDGLFSVKGGWLQRIGVRVGERPHKGSACVG